ncbi:MAG: universal stress protein, partial [Bacteroidota bacterium]
TKNNRSMKKIFVPIDFSDTSAHAARFAMKLAQDMDAMVHLFHAYYDPIVDRELPDYGLGGPTTSVSSTTEAVLHNIEVETQQGMAKLESELRNDFIEVPLTSEIVRGFPEVMVPQRAKDVEADLILMGPRQIPRFFKILTGSITAEVIKESELPVLVIPEKGDYKAIRNVLFTSSFEESDAEKIQKFNKLFEGTDFKLMVGFIHDDHGVAYEPEDYGGLRQALMDHIRMRLPELEMEFLATGDRRLWHGLNELVENYGADLLIMTTRHRSFFEGLISPSATQQMVIKTEKPLLIFHA